MARGATLLAAVALWVWAASLLWRTSVPHLDLPQLDPRAIFGPELVGRAERYDRILRLDWVLSAAAQLAALAVVAARASRLRLGLGRIGSGIVLATLAVTSAWGASLPFHLAAFWWRRHYGIVHEASGPWVAGQLEALLTTAGGAFVAVVLVTALAAPLGRRWWLAAAPLAAAAALAVTFAGAWLESGHAPGALRDEEQGLAVREGVRAPALEVVPAPGRTREANAEAIGLGPSRRIVLWTTILRRPFTGAEVRFVLAHELTHHARHHLWKGLAWFALLSLPVLALVAAAVDLRRPEAVPLALLLLLAAQLALLPLRNAISRRLETEADWQALRTTRDPAAAQDLFIAFARTSVQPPDPPGWDYVLLEDHPTLLQRVELARAWELTRRASPAGS